MNNDYLKFSNSELNIILKELENEYEMLKNKIRESLGKMEILDKKYKDVKEILTKRTKGKI